MMQVLVVDDQRMPRDNMEQILAASGRYEVAASISSAELAIIKCKQQPIDLILMDVCTKGSKNGIDAAAEIKQQFPNIKIIIVTSMVEVSYLERAKDAKADSFWYKDLSREELIDSRLCSRVNRGVPTISSTARRWPALFSISLD